MRQNTAALVVKLVAIFGATNGNFKAKFLHLWLAHTFLKCQAAFDVLLLLQSYAKYLRDNIVILHIQN